MDEFDIRECAFHEEFDQCIQLQRQVWNYSDLDVMPHHSYVITRNSGGFTLGAFTRDHGLAGFVHTWMARRAGTFCFYSHMLAVVEEYRSKGIGRRLKLAQRAEALRRGADRIVWTFDPLQARNAHFNINRLGVTSRVYEVNYYGTASTSPLHRGLETDRLFVDWWLNSPRVLAQARGESLEPGTWAAQVEIPSDIGALKATDPERARLVQLEVRSQFHDLLGAGLFVGGFRRVPQRDAFTYLLFEGKE